MTPLDLSTISQGGLHSSSLSHLLFVPFFMSMGEDWKTIETSCVIKMLLEAQILGMGGLALRPALD
jgi:hypothetical protein